MNYYLSEGSLKDLKFKELGRFKMGGTKIGTLGKLNDDITKYTYLCWVITKTEDAELLDYSYDSNHIVMNGTCSLVSDLLVPDKYLEAVHYTSGGTKCVARLEYWGKSEYTDVVCGGTKGYYGILYGI